MQEDIVNALALTGQVLMGQAVMVKSSEVRVPALMSAAVMSGFGTLVLVLHLPWSFMAWQRSDILSGAGSYLMHR